MKNSTKQPTCSYTLPGRNWILRLIPKENSFQFNGKLYLQTHFIAIDTKTVSFANIFMEYIETQSLRKNVFKSTVWKRRMDYIFPVG